MGEDEPNMRMPLGECRELRAVGRFLSRPVPPTVLPDVM
jgi:hypothetical protein